MRSRKKNRQDILSPNINDNNNKNNNNNSKINNFNNNINTDNKSYKVKFKHRPSASCPPKCAIMWYPQSQNVLPEFYLHVSSSSSDNSPTSDTSPVFRLVFKGLQF